MKDSILKGTGNSRFLKSAIPDGTTWAEALAMLRAGTFPMDLNGINNAGFQQIGTPLNKANLLKDVNALTLGLTGDAVPNDMFNVLAHAGDLHVWKKTVVNSQAVPEVPGSYSLGESQQLIVATRNTSSSSRSSRIVGALASNSLSVDLAGNVSLDNPATISIMVTASGNPTETASTVLSGYNYFMIPDSATGNFCDITVLRNAVYFVPSYATYTPTGNAYGGQSNFNIAQLVTGVPGTPAIPAGTTVTYPVSTNCNAYQEGSDAKPAGYTLGDVETGKFVLGTGVGSNAQNMFYISSSVTVDDSGNISQENQGSTYINGESGNAMQGQANNVIGKFVVLNSKQSNSDFDVGTIWYIPPDVTIRNSYSTDGEAYDQYNIINYVTKRQRVTGYAAIPANTTIEYLGCLGEKTRMQVVSYVGTGTYGANNPCSLTFDFPPRFIIFIGESNLHGLVFMMETLGLTTEYVSDRGFGNALSGYRYAKIDSTGKTVSWFQTVSASYQFNVSGKKYQFLAFE